MMVLIPETILHIIRHYKISVDAPLIAAVSGGMDSVVMLHALCQVQQQAALRVHVATLNHGLRAEAARDTALVEALARDLGLPVTVGQVDCAALSRHWSIGLEAAARRARYDFLAQVAEQQGSKVILTAHHADDQAETVLLHLLRGSGVDGLAGMVAFADVPGHGGLMLVRPMLQVTRGEIERYCLEHHLSYAQDESNADLRFTRNRIRHDVLPALAAINPQIADSLRRLADAAQADSIYLRQVSAAMVALHCQRSGGRVTVDRAAFEQMESAIQRRVLHDLAKEFTTDVAWQHVVHAQKVAIQGHVGAVAQFPAGVQLRVDYAVLWLERAMDPLPVADYWLLDAAKEVVLPGETLLANAVLSASDEPQQNTVCRLLIRADVPLMLRKRVAGDRFQPAGMGGRFRKLKEWFIDHKIPQHVRDDIPLLVQDNRIVAIVLPGRWVVAQPIQEDAIQQRFVCLGITYL
jgi:tRNA(Ile)-lysidine synthase